MTILPEAYNATRRILGLSNFEDHKGYQWAWGAMSTRAGREIVVVLGRPLDRDNVAAATFVGTMLDAWQPRYLLVVDIGGGIAARGIQLGDVVTHTVVHYYDHYKVQTTRRESPRYLPVAPASTKLRELSRRPYDRGDASWIERIDVARPDAGTPTVHPGEMLVGGAIQANSPRLRHLISEYEKALVVEMEGVGAGRAVLDWSLKGKTPEFLIIRGVSDYCDSKPADNQRTREHWREYAAAAASAHAHALLLELNLKRRKQAMQSDTVPTTAVGSPKVDNLWTIVRTTVIGRERELAALRDHLSSYQPPGFSRSPHVICGEAGMGKSVLARSISEEVGSQYVSRWWVDASSEIGIRTGLREFARTIGIPSAGVDSSEDAPNAAKPERFLVDLRDALVTRGQHGRALFILDNVDDAQLKHNLPRTLVFLPPTACDVLITSQSSQWAGVASHTTELTGLDENMAARLVAQESGQFAFETDSNVRAICREFGGRPLFLRLIGAVLRESTPEEFKERLASSPEEALDVLPEKETFEPLWRATYRMAIDRAEGSRSGSRDLLEVMAFFAPEAVPLRLLRASAADPRSSASVDAALTTLAGRSLVQTLRGADSHEKSYSLHRIVAALVRMEVKAKSSTLPLESAILAIDRVIPRRDDLRRSDGRRSMSDIAVHVDAVVEYAIRDNGVPLVAETRERAADASSMLGLYRRTLSEWAAAEEAHYKAVQLSSAQNMPGDAALRKVRWANVMRQRGNFVPAEQHLTQALEPLKKYGHVRDYAWALTVQARILRARPDSASVEALPILQLAKELLNRHQDDSDPGAIRQLSELYGYASVINRLLSNIEAAEGEARQGLALIARGRRPEEILSSSDRIDEPLVGTHLRALGGVWRLRGQFEKAALAHKKAVEIFEQAYGRNHTDVGRALDSLGRVQREWGDLDAALESFTRAEQISDLQFGPGYPHAGTAAVNRALVFLEASGSADPKLALAEAERGLKIYRNAYSEGTGGSIRNEATAWALFVRGSALLALGDLPTAEADHQTVLNWRERRYSKPHAHTASSHFAFGDVLLRKGDEASRELGIQHHLRSLEIRKAVFGDGSDYWLAQSQARVGELLGRFDLLKLAHETFETQLRAGHWRTQEVSRAMSELREAR